MNFSLSLFPLIFFALSVSTHWTIFSLFFFSLIFFSFLFTEFHLVSSSHSDFTNPIEETKATTTSFYRFHSRVLRIAIRSTPPSPTHEWNFTANQLIPRARSLRCRCCGEERTTGEIKIYVSRSFCHPPAQRSRMEKQQKAKKALDERPTQYRSKARWWRQTGSRLACVGANERKTKLWFDLVIVDTNQRWEKGAEAPKLVSLMK